MIDTKNSDADEIETIQDPDSFIKVVVFTSEASAVKRSDTDSSNDDSSNANPSLQEEQKSETKESQQSTNTNEVKAPIDSIVDEFNVKEDTDSDDFVVFPSDPALEKQVDLELKEFSRVTKPPVITQKPIEKEH